MVMTFVHTAVITIASSAVESLLLGSLSHHLFQLHWLRWCWWWCGMFVATNAKSYHLSQPCLLHVALVVEK